MVSMDEPYKFTNINAESKCREIIDWLLPGSFDDAHAAFRGQRRDGTGQWFLDEVHSWLIEPEARPFLWCRGIRNPPNPHVRKLWQS